MSNALAAELGRIVGADHALPATSAAYLRDETETRGVVGYADAVVRPGTAHDVAAVLAWCYERDLPIVPRGGGTGFAGGAVPRGGVVLSLERLTRVRSFDPLLWRIHVEAGLRTSSYAELRARAALSSPPIREQPSSRTSAATSPRTPADRTPSSTE